MATAKPTLTDAIKAANKQLASCYNAGDVAGVAACYTKTAVLMPPNSPALKGKKIAAFWEGAMAMGVKRISLRTGTVEQHGTTAIETGVATLKLGDGTVADVAKYLVVWKREGRAWKLHYDIFNSNQPAA
jgi:ketosteroid isomerase-like protein